MTGLARAAICGLLMMAPGIATAATLTATFGSDVNLSALGFQGAVAGQTAFTIDFDDTLGNAVGVLEGSEFGSFAWVNNPFTIASTGQQFRTLLGVAPTIAGLVAGFFPPAVTQPFSPSSMNWIFREAPGSSTGSSIAVSVFTYSITLPPPPPPPVGAVPLPAGAFLLVGALAGIAALRRRRG